MLFQFNSLFDPFASNWEIGIGKNNLTIKWLPIGTIEFYQGYKRRIGLTENGVWVNTVEREPSDKQILLIEDRQDCYYVMAILEKDRLEIEELISKGLEKNKLQTALIYSFPFKELLKFTLTNSTHYWGLKAITWLRQEEFDDEFVEISNKIIEKKELDQKSRHTLFKLINRYKKFKSADNL